MKTLSISYPNSLLGSLHVSEVEFEREARMAMAVKLFDTGRLSSGQAAELAEMPRVCFLYELGRWRVSALQVRADELENDLAVAQSLHDRYSTEEAKYPDLDALIGSWKEDAEFDAAIRTFEKVNEEAGK